ncbi:hypothetical protein BSQ98_24650, partial [Serratia liquefaciens]|uniref:hypothetical protein n=1 Tax=Serratia liquefaciens TaxID=614 RepID=UPI0010D1F7DC
TGADDSTVKWQWRNSNGEWKLFTSNSKFDGNVYTPGSDDAGDVVRACVTPKGKEQSIKGSEVCVAQSDLITIAGTPEVRDVTRLPEASLVGKALDVSYTFVSNGTGDDGSIYQWEYWENDEWKVPNDPKAKEKRWTPDSGYVGYSVLLRITPRGKGYPLITGNDVHSGVVYIYSAPKITGLSAPASSPVDKELDVTYRFISNGSGNDVSTYQWEYLEGGRWHVPDAQAAKQRKWTPDASYAGYQVRLCATPRGDSAHASGLTGEKACSNSVDIYKLSLPIVTVNLPSISLADKPIDVTGYNYNPNGAGSDVSTYQWEYLEGGRWKVPNTPAAKKKEWTPDASYAGYSVRLSVTPKGGANSAASGDIVHSNEVEVYTLSKPDITWIACFYKVSMWPPSRQTRLEAKWRTEKLPKNGVSIYMERSDMGNAKNGSLNSVIGGDTGSVSLYFRDRFGNESEKRHYSYSGATSCDIKG